MGYVKFAVGMASALVAISALAPAARAADASQTIPTGRETEAVFTVDALYDSNVARTDRQLAALRGLKLADEVFSPGVDITVARPLGRALLFLHTTDTYDFHVVNSVRNRGDTDNLVGASGHFGPCQEVLTNEYALLHEDLSEITPIIAGQPGATVLNNTQQRETVKFAAKCGRPIGLAPSASIEQSWLHNSARLFRFIDNRTTTAEASLAYQRPAFGSVAVFGNFVQATLPNRILPGPHGLVTYGYDVYSAGGRLVRPVGSRIEATVSVSFTSLDPTVQLSKPFRGLTYSLDTTYHVTGRFAVHASASRATVPSNRLYANYSIDEDYEGDISYRLGSRLTLKLSETHLTSNYQGLVTAQPMDLTHISSDTYLGSATFQMTRRLAFSLTASDEERTANFPGLSYSDTKVNLQARVTF